MKMVTITLSGITQTVPENELPLYTRAGYKVVEESAPVATPEPVAPAADPESVAEESAPAKKTGKKN
jgi:hypothetical protein